MKTLKIDGKQISFDNERNLLEVIRNANINLPTFCYHSELSIYGACRLCVVNIEGRGIQTSCTLPPEEGMVVYTNTQQLRTIRKNIIELLLASEYHNCTTCAKSMRCKLQTMAKELNVTEVRYKSNSETLKPLDLSSLALVRDPNKCILCGDCVRACDEIQGIGVLDFSGRGANVTVVPAFGKGLAEVDCVDCGQCSRVCPTGAILPRSEIKEVWNAINDPNKIVIGHFAPSVRVAIGEEFGMPIGSILPGQLSKGLRMLGFNSVYDTSFTADLTIMEEGTEFIKRKTGGGTLPLFTSCCPAWVKYVEQYYPELLNNLSTCRSPQAMFGSILKKYLPKILDCNPKQIVVVSIMPCTAKKVEARRPEFETDGMRDNDYVLTTQELAIMFKQSGIVFSELEPDGFDEPFAQKTGAGVIFGNSGGVTEAALRYVVEKIENRPLEKIDFHEVRGADGCREAELTVAGMPVKIAVVHGLKNAKELIKKIKAGEVNFDFIEVMTCPGGCIGGAGQPVYFKPEVRKARTDGLYKSDKMMHLHKSQENEDITNLYKNHIGDIGGKEAHHSLHTHYHSRKRINTNIAFDSGDGKINVSVCIGTNCFVRGSQDILKKLMNYVIIHNLSDIVNVKPSFCMENCGIGPNVVIGDKLISEARFDTIIEELENKLKSIAIAN
ncbi:MAG: [FeFe] hydrogenase, group A [Bacteroidetes bacterium]|nr:[FeFe] hydrogenase, group A [Bacteroidota bacterium]